MQKLAPPRIWLALLSLLDSVSDAQSKPALPSMQKLAPPDFKLPTMPVNVPAPRPPHVPAWVRAFSHAKPPLPSPIWRAFLLVATLAATISFTTLTMPPRGEREQTSQWRRRLLCRFAFAFSAANPVFSVLANEYTFIRDPASSYIVSRARARASDPEETLRRLVTGVGAVKPRRLFVVGAVLRGLQLHSPLRHFFDPPSHFGAGLNLLALFDGVAWPASFTLGWAASQWWWALGDDDSTASTVAIAEDTTQYGTSVAARGARANRVRGRGRTTPPAMAGLPAMGSSEATYTDGLRVQLVLPPAHLEAITFLMAFCGAWRWALLVLVSAGRWKWLGPERAAPARAI